jgi:hypothetical protein
MFQNLQTLWRSRLHIWHEGLLRQRPDTHRPRHDNNACNGQRLSAEGLKGLDTNCTWICFFFSLPDFFDELATKKSLAVG